MSDSAPPPRPPAARHIVSFAQTLRGGGVERVLLRLAGGWVERGRRVTLVVGDARGPLAAELPAGVGVMAAGGGRYRDLLRAARGVGALSPDVIFCPGNHYTGVAAVARLSSAAPIVAKLSNALVGVHRPPVAWGYAAWLRLHPCFIDHLVTMSPAMAEQAARAMAMPAERIDIIANPPARNSTDASPIALPPGRFILGVGRLAPQKRWDRLIAALPRLSDTTLALVILGEGAERATLAALAERLGVAHRVHLPGHAADAAPAMRAAAVVALTSDYEGVPGALAEAIALGTPVVTTDSSVAIAELVPDRDTGSIVPRGDANALAAALERWLAPNAERPVPHDGDRTDSIEAYLALFDRLIAGRAPPTRPA